MGRGTAEKSRAQMSSQLPPHHCLCKPCPDYLTAISDLSDALARGLGNAITGNVLDVLMYNILVLIVIPVLKRLID